MTFDRRAYKRQCDREWVAARRAEAMRGAACAHCGSTVDLQLDHIDPATKIDSRIWSWSKVRREAEIAKCQWLCVSCHQIKTCRERGLPDPFTHGTRSMYGDHGCRCEICRLGQAERRRKSPLSTLGVDSPMANALKTGCKHGHPFTVENTALVKRGALTFRQCRTCAARITRENYRRKKERLAA